ncbi:MAG: hypothetical protein DME08_24690 [Candidatus Rokuibacteriota bacterium]|nr:MAG: hypothetical protein DME08_24690 [Candidatus Rokubacteria bacterium]
MRYLLLSCSDDKSAPPLTRAEMDALIQEHMRFSEKLRAAGKAALEWAKQVPLRDGRFIEVRPIWKM